MSYAFPPGGLPGQEVSPVGTAVFTEAYAVLPAETQRDIVTSLLPGWVGARAWILARPLSGFAETFAQYASNWPRAVAVTSLSLMQVLRRYCSWPRVTGRSP